MRRAVFAAAFLVVACTTTVSVDTNGDGFVDDSEVCASWCACAPSRETCEYNCALQPGLPRSCDQQAAKCVLEEKFDGDGCSYRTQDDCYQQECLR